MGGSSPPFSHAQGAGSPLAGRGRRPPAERRRGARAGVTDGHPRGETGRGQQPPPSNRVTARACCPGRAKLWPRQRGQRAEGEATPALSGRRRPGVAAGHPKEKKERERKERKERKERRRKGKKGKKKKGRRKRKEEKKESSPELEGLAGVVVVVAGSCGRKRERGGRN